MGCVHGTTHQLNSIAWMGPVGELYKRSLERRDSGWEEEKEQIGSDKWNREQQVKVEKDRNHIT